MTIVIETFFAGLMAGSLYSMTAISIILIFRVSGVLNFAQGGLCLFAGLTFIGLMENLGGHWILAGALTVTIMIIFAWVIERLILRYLRRGEPLISFFVTVGLAYVLVGMGGLLWGGDVKRLDNIFMKGTSDYWRHVHGLYIEKFDIVSSLIVIAAMACLALFLIISRLGLSVRAMADDYYASLASGISLSRVQVVVWSLAGFVALVTGILWGLKSGVQVSLSLIALKAIPVLIIGGVTSIIGAIVGGLLIGIGERFAIIYINPLLGGAVESWFAYMLALLFLLIWPQGIFSQRMFERI